MASTWMSMDHSRVKLCRKQDQTRDSITHELWQELILYLWDYVTNMTWMVFQFSQPILLRIICKVLFVSITFSREILSFLRNYIVQSCWYITIAKPISGGTSLIFRIYSTSNTIWNPKLKPWTQPPMLQVYIL